MAADDSEWLKLPTEEKCVHKVWKARLAGYEEATKLFRSITDERSPEFSKYLGSIKKFVVDSNAIAQEKGLEAVAAFVENAAIAGKTVGEVSSGLVAKCLNSNRAKTKERAMEILIMYIEIEKQEAIMDELLKGLSNKQPKVVTSCVQVLKEAVSGFGNKVIAFKPIVKQLQGLLDHRDKTVREETKLLAVEIYRWIRDAIKPQLANLKPLQLTELEGAFAEASQTKAVQTRFLRSQQDLRTKFEAKAEAGEEDDTEEADEIDAPEVDAYDLLDPVDILSKIPKDYHEKIEAKKWQERREALESVKKLSESPKLQPGDYGDLIRTIIKVVAKDNNVMLVALAARIIADLATGLRKKFNPYSLQCVKAIFEKFKEKKASVVAALREAIDAVYLTTTLDAISEDSVTALDSKNPSVKLETVLFLGRAFTRCTPTTLPKKLLKLFCSALCKTMNDTLADTREASYQTLGTAMKVVGEKNIQPSLGDVDSIKDGKIKEYCEKAELLFMRGKTCAPKPAAAPVVKKVERPKISCTTKSASQSGKKRPGTAPAKAKSGAKKVTAGSEEPAENELADEAVEEKANALLTEENVAKLSSSNWKERLAGMEAIADVIKGLSREDIPAQVIVRTINKKPGLKDTNFQVLKARLDLIAHVAQNAKFTQRSSFYCLKDMIDKIGDVKNGTVVQEGLTAIAEATSLEFVGHKVLSTAFEQKNPKTQSEALIWLTRAIKEFGFKVNVKGLLSNIKIALASPNPAVRTPAITLIGVLHMYMGPQLRMFFESEKPALLQQIDTEIEKVKEEKRPTPFRGLSKGTAAEVVDSDEGEGEEEVKIADLVPRADIGDKLTEDLFTEMADKNWKVRNEALQKLAAILNEAKFIQGNIGNLPESLKLRLADANKILVNTTLGICLNLANAMGPHSKIHFKILMPAVLTCMGDGKPNVRASALNTVNAWIDQCGMSPLVEGELLADTMKLENPVLRAELLGWLAEKLPTAKKLPTELNLCIPYLFSCVEDRNANVRQKAQEAIVPFMIHTGFDKMNVQAGKLKPSSKEQIKPILEKARGNLPAKPSKARPTSVAMSAPGPSLTSPTFEEEAEDSSQRQTSAPKSGSAKPKASKKAPPAKTTKKKKVPTATLR